MGKSAGEGSRLLWHVVRRPRAHLCWVIGPFSTEAIPGAGLHCSHSVLHLAFPIWLSLLPLGTAWAEGLDAVLLTVGRFAEIFFRPLLRSTSCNQWRRCREKTVTLLQHLWRGRV